MREHPGLGSASFHRLAQLRCGSLRGHQTARDRQLLSLHALPAAHWRGGVPSARPAPGSFHIVEGDDRPQYSKPADAGEKWSCGDCGSSIFGRSLSHPDSIGIRIGTSTRIPGSGRASARSLPTPRPGRQFPTTACPATRKAATQRRRRQTTTPVSGQPPNRHLRRALESGDTSGLGRPRGIVRTCVRSEAVRSRPDLTSAPASR